MGNDPFLALQEAIHEIDKAVAHLKMAFSLLRSAASDPSTGAAPPEVAEAAARSPKPRRQPATHQVTSQQPLTGAQQAVLSAISRLQRSNSSQMHLILIAALTGHSPSDKTFREALDKLEQKHLVSSTKTTATLTEKGQRLSLDSLSPLTADTLVQRVAMQLTKRQRAVLNLLFEKNGNELGLNDLAKSVGSAPTDPSLRRDLRKLQELSLVRRVTSTSYACSDLLFL